MWNASIHRGTCWAQIGVYGFVKCLHTALRSVVWSWYDDLMINDKEMPATIIRESWAERQAKYSIAKLDAPAEVDYDRPRPPIKNRNHSVKHRAIR